MAPGVADAEGLPAHRARPPRRSTAARPTSEWKAATSCGIAVIGDAARDDRADAAADGDADDDQSPADAARRRGDAQQRGQRWRSPCRSCRRGCPAATSSGRRQAAQRQDEQDAGDEIEERPRGWRSSARPQLPSSCTWRACAAVTRKPPKMLTQARISATKPKMRAQTGCRLVADEVDADREQRADDDHRGDGVGDRHQRRVQRRRHRPDHVVADEDRQHEDRRGGRRRDRSTPPAASPRASRRALGGLVGIELRGLGGLRGGRRRRPAPSSAARRATGCAIRCLRDSAAAAPRSCRGLRLRSSDARPRRRASARSP